MPKKWHTQHFGMYILYLALLFSWSQLEILRQERKKQWVKDLVLNN